MPTETRGQMVDRMPDRMKMWLIEQRAFHSFGNPSDEHSRETVEVINAILAALDGPSVNERMAMLSALDCSKIFGDWKGREKEFDLIRALILGNQGGAVTGEQINKILSSHNFYDRHDRETARHCMKEMLREAGIETGVAGKEEAKGNVPIFNEGGHSNEEEKK